MHCPHARDTHQGGATTTAGHASSPYIIAYRSDKLHVPRGLRYAAYTALNTFSHHTHTHRAPATLRRLCTPRRYRLPAHRISRTRTIRLLATCSPAHCTRTARYTRCHTTHAHRALPCCVTIAPACAHRHILSHTLLFTTSHAYTLPPACLPHTTCLHTPLPTAHTTLLPAYTPAYTHHTHTHLSFHATFPLPAPFTSPTLPTIHNCNAYCYILCLCLCTHHPCTAYALHATPLPAHARACTWWLHTSQSASSMGEGAGMKRRRGLVWNGNNVAGYILLRRRKQLMICHYHRTACHAARHCACLCLFRTAATLPR